jgi:hypothetical protein
MISPLKGHASATSALAQGALVPVSSEKLTFGAFRGVSKNKSCDFEPMIWVFAPELVLTSGKVG